MSGGCWAGWAGLAGLGWLGRDGGCCTRWVLDAGCCPAEPVVLCQLSLALLARRLQTAAWAGARQLPALPMLPSHHHSPARPPACLHPTCGRFKNNQFVCGEPHLRFYAGAPLVSSDSGHRLGTLCVFDFRPRSFPAQQYAMLANFAEILVREMERSMVSRLGWGGDNMPRCSGLCRVRCCAQFLPARGCGTQQANAPTRCLPAPAPVSLPCRPCSCRMSR